MRSWTEIVGPAHGRAIHGRTVPFWYPTFKRHGSYTEVRYLYNTQHSKPGQCKTWEAAQNLPGMRSYFTIFPSRLSVVFFSMVTISEIFASWDFFGLLNSEKSLWSHGWRTDRFSPFRRHLVNTEEGLWFLGRRLKMDCACRYSISHSFSSHILVTILKRMWRS